MLKTSLNALKTGIIHRWRSFKYRHYRLATKIDRLKAYRHVVPRVDLERANASAKRREEELVKELEAVKSKLGEIIPKLVRLSQDIPFTSSGRQERFRLILEMDPFLIRQCFEFGNDDRAMHYVAEYVGHMFYRELKTCNLQRFEETYRDRGFPPPGMGTIFHRW